MLHLLAVDSLLDVSTCTDFGKDQTSPKLVQWFQNIKMCQSVINSIVSSSSQHHWVEKLKQKWQLIQAMKMFYEHIVFKHTEVSPKYAKKMKDVSSSRAIIS